MAVKNILAATDFVSGKDNRYRNSVVIGKVVKLECTDKGANLRVQMPEKLDRKGNPLITKPIPMLQISAGQKRSFAMPRVGQNVLMVKRSNGTGDYLAVGHFYTSNDPPPVTDPKLDYCEWEGGHIEKFDANENADVFLTQDFKGGWNNTCKKAINIKTTDGAPITLQADSDVNIKAPNGTILLDQQNIHLKGPVTIDGDITHNGNMTTYGVHTDNNGLHTNAAELLRRIEALEARVAELERRENLSSKR